MWQIKESKNLQLTLILVDLVPIVNRSVIGGRNLEVLIHDARRYSHLGFVVEESAAHGWLFYRNLFFLRIIMNACGATPHWLMTCFRIYELLTHETAPFRFELASLSLHFVNAVSDIH